MIQFLTFPGAAHLTEGPVFEDEGEVGGGPVEVGCAGAPLQHLLVGSLEQAVPYVVPVIGE